MLSSGVGAVRRASYDVTSTMAGKCNAPVTRSVSDSITDTISKVLTYNCNSYSREKETALSECEVI